MSVVFQSIQIKKVIRKMVAVVLAASLCTWPLYPRVVFAEDQPVEELQTPAQTSETPAPDPAPDPAASVDNSAAVTDDVSSSGVSGENTIEALSPTPEPTPETTETPADESPTPDPTPDATPEASASSVQTGDAISIVTVDNTVNLTSLNSGLDIQTIDVNGQQNTDVSVPGNSSPGSSTDGTQSQNSGGSGSATIDNTAQVTNDISSSANTGGNSLESASSAAIVTGDAYVVISVLNNVNTTLVDSAFTFFTINIFGSLTGNILLPETSTTAQGTCCYGVIQQTNGATVENSVTSEAVSGRNTIESSGSANLETGSAASIVNILNFVNTTYLNTQTRYLFINLFGTWNGNFLGWEEFQAATGSASLAFASLTPTASADTTCDTCYKTISVENSAHVNNTITATANTGGNTVSATNATIRTGNAYSAVSLVNFLNSTFINSVGYFGFINIFGTLAGDIGGASLFPTPTPAADVNGALQEQQSATDNNGPSVRESGGYLEVTQTNNVGEYVLPGDTVTFFVTIRNPGPGRVYDTVLSIDLIRDGVTMGSISFPIGTVKPFGTVKFTTGLVLSDDAAAGLYTAHATVSGVVGPDNTTVSASSDSTFLIVGYTPWVPGGIAGGAQASGPQQEVLGEQTGLSRSALEQRLRVLLLSLVTLYLTFQAIRRRQDIAIAMYQLRFFL